MRAVACNTEGMRERERVVIVLKTALGRLDGPQNMFSFLIPVVLYANEGGWVRQNTTVVGPYLLVRR